MSEEKKDEKAIEQVAQKPSEQAQAKALVKEVAPKRERPSNCAACNKSMKRKRWYYRNGKYYCTKRCWKTTVKKEEKPKDAEARTSA